MYIILFPF